MSVKQGCRGGAGAGRSTWHEGCVSERPGVERKHILHVILGADVQFVLPADVPAQLNAAAAHLVHQPLPGDGVTVGCQKTDVQAQVDAHRVCKHQPWA